MSKRSLEFFSNSVLALFWSLFLYINIVFFRISHNPTQALAALEACLTIVMFLTRRRALITTPFFLDHGIAFSCTLFPLLLRPAPSGWPYMGTIVMTLGIALSTVALAFLGRSFGISPALRRVRSAGPYRFIRHPMYAGALIAIVGYLLGNSSWYNGSVLMMSLVLIFLRIIREETLLKKDEGYRRYAHMTPFRLIPLLY